MINVIPLTIEILVAILLLCTILYCVRLNRQLQRLQSDETTMKTTIAELLAASENAERAIEGLKATVREADQSLSKHLEDAERYCGEIVRNTEAGADVLRRITLIACAKPAMLGASSGAESKATKAEANDGKTRDLKRNDPKSIVAAAQAIAERARSHVKAAAA